MRQPVMLDLSATAGFDSSQTPAPPVNGSTNEVGASVPHHQAKVDEGNLNARQTQVQTQNPKRTRVGPSLRSPFAKRTLAVTARGPERQSNGANNANEVSLLDDDMLLSILGWEMADDAEDGTAHGSFAVAAAMQRASSSAAQEMSGDGGVNPSEHASLTRNAFNFGVDDSVTGGMSAAAALTKTSLAPLIPQLRTFESSIGHPATGFQAYLSLEDRAGERRGEQQQQQQQQQQRQRQQRHATEQDESIIMQHRMQSLLQSQSQPAVLSQPPTSHLAGSSSTLASVEHRGIVEVGWPSRGAGSTLPSSTAAQAPSQSPWILPPPSLSVRGGNAAEAALQGSRQPTGSLDQDMNPESERGDPNGGILSLRVPLVEDEMPEGLLNEATAALLEPSDRPGSPSGTPLLTQHSRGADPAVAPNSAGPWHLSSEPVNACKAEAKHQWQQLEERSRRLDAVVREKEQLQAALLQSKARLQEAQRLLRCKLCRIARRNCVVLPCMHFSYCHSCIAAHCATDAHCPACASPVSGFQTLLLID